MSVIGPVQSRYHEAVQVYSCEKMLPWPRPPLILVLNVVLVS